MTAKKVTTKPAAEAMQLYTIRLQPSIVAKLEAKAKKLKVTHAQVARDAIAAAVARAA